jgi:hypothetical protein
VIESAADIDVAGCDTQVGGDPWTSVDEFDMNNIVSIYPNPFSNIISIEVDTDQVNGYNLTVYNS